TNEKQNLQERLDRLQATKVEGDAAASARPTREIEQLKLKIKSLESQLESAHNEKKQLEEQLAKSQSANENASSRISSSNIRLVREISDLKQKINQLEKDKSELQSQYTGHKER